MTCWINQIDVEIKFLKTFQNVCNCIKWNLVENMCIFVEEQNINYTCNCIMVANVNINKI